MSVDAVNVLGVAVSAINMDLALEQITGALEKRQKGYVCVTGVHGVSEAQADSEFRRILNRAFLCTPDGMPLVWVGRWRGHKQMDRVYGPDLMLAMMSLSEKNGWQPFFLRRRQRDGGDAGPAALGAISQIANRRRRRTAVPSVERRGRRTSAGEDSRRAARCDVGRLEHAQTGTVHGANI